MGENNEKKITFSQHTNNSSLKKTGEIAKQISRVKPKLHPQACVKCIQQIVLCQTHPSMNV